MRQDHLAREAGEVESAAAEGVRAAPIPRAVILAKARIHEHDMAEWSGAVQPVASKPVFLDPRLRGDDRGVLPTPLSCRQIR